MRKRFPRALSVVLIGLGFLILAGAGTVWTHYRSTPTFREWVRATPYCFGHEAVRSFQAYRAAHARDRVDKKAKFHAWVLIHARSFT